jgi:alanine racemase
MSQSWVEIDLGALEHNIKVLSARVGDRVRVAPVVKSNAYGHGLELAAPAFVRAGARWLCVHSFREATRLRALELGAEILILGPLSPEENVPAVAAGFHCTTATRGQILALAAAAKKLNSKARLHLKIETGTHRQGVVTGELDAVAALLRGDPHLELAGVHSHLANVEDTTRHEFAQEQLRRYREAVDGLRAAGLGGFLRHMASSAAAILFDETHFDLLRPGIAAYGHWPSRETFVSAKERQIKGLDLRPALSWKVPVAQIQQVEAGEHVGYGCSHRLEVDSRVAVLSVGYADGYRRDLGGRAYVRIGGRRCPVVGRICMNLMMVDVTHVPEAKEGDTAVLLAPDADGGPSAETVAEWAGSISYEILASIRPELPRRGA